MRAVLVLSIIMYLNTISYSQIINVPSEQVTIQNGIIAATDGDTVLVHPGTYNENIDFQGKRITLASLFLITNDTSYINNTIINGNNNNVIEFISGEDTLAVLCGFTIQNGGSGIYINNSSPNIYKNTIVNNHSYDGAGIYGKNTSAVISHNYIHHNVAESMGGGIYIWASRNSRNPKIIYNDICYNKSENDGSSSTYGGGVANYTSHVDLINNTIRFNSANGQYSYGGGIWGDGAGGSATCQYRAYGNLIANNTSNMGGGVYLWRITSSNLSNCTILNNRANTDGGGIFYSYESLDIDNTIIWGNEAPNGSQIATEYSYPLNIRYCILQDGIDGIAGDCLVDTLFVSKENPLIQVQDIFYHIDINSPCIDAGNNEYINNFMSFDLLNNDRIIDGNNDSIPVVDIGAIEQQISTPVAAFASDTTIGILPFEVQFSDSSTGFITSWEWDFGDGSTSTDQNPVHTYEVADTFTVSLTVTGPDGTDTETKENYIVVTNPSGVAENSEPLPSSFALSQNYPNPFNPSTQIEYDVKEACQVNLIAYNLRGQVVRELVNLFQQPGKYSLNLNLEGILSGIYFYRIQMGDFHAVKKMVKIE
jgi:hypothetical protein